ncbi:MAG: hypothetical protein HeimC2_26100 [Candidatus Heimdallarchaeota archaeon LC_2]|nr:MAG: hypothetical protein HeimC2_26100 [Candidatus Heimdallarchaeota archaeon LC_2]
MEYKVMKKKFSKSVQTALKEDLVAIIVYGGAASKRIFSGVSDIDFFIILKSLDNLSKPLSETYQVLSEVMMQYLEDPLFSSILDYDILVEDQLPTAESLRGFSSVRALALSEGELLYGENPFKDLKIDETELKYGARVMVQDYLDKLTSLLFMPNFDVVPEDGEKVEDESLEAEREFLAVDAILSAGQAYQMVQKKEYVNMPDVVLFGETDPIDGIDNPLLQDAGLLRQGVDVNVDNFYNRAIDFCGSILKLI